MKLSTPWVPFGDDTHVQSLESLYLLYRRFLSSRHAGISGASSEIIAANATITEC